MQLAKWLQMKLHNLLLIDCRYPYEYEGGHIEGALNLHTEDMIHHSLLNEPPSGTARPPVIVFHCEYSSYRGPSRYEILFFAFPPIDISNLANVLKLYCFSTAYC